jgi:hypothetical protein
MFVNFVPHAEHSLSLPGFLEYAFPPHPHKLQNFKTSKLQNLQTYPLLLVFVADFVPELLALFLEVVLLVDLLLFADEEVLVDLLVFPFFPEDFVLLLDFVLVLAEEVVDLVLLGF